MLNISQYIRTFLVFVAHFLIYRTSIFISCDREFTGIVWFEKFVAGFLYDMQFLFIIFFMISIINLVFKSDKFLKISFVFFFLLISILDLVNFYMLGYFSDGLASTGVLFEYLADLDTILKMGVGTFNPLPPILLFVPILFFFIPKLKNIEMREISKRNFIIILVIANIIFNQGAKAIRVNKNGALESNTLIRILRSESNTAKIFDEVKKLKNMKLTESDLKLIHTNTEAKYISAEYPLLKEDDITPIADSMDRPNIVLFLFESVSSFQTGIKEFYSDEDKKVFDDHKSYTPFLDTLLPYSVVAPNFYAHGTFTTLGQVSMLCSVYDPVSALDGKGSIMRNYYGTNLKCLPEYLSDLGYKNMFFNGYHSGFDNKAMFFPKIGIDELYCRDEIKSLEGIALDEHTWGLQDSTVLSYMGKKLDSINGPFFATFMSVNTHAPYNHIKSLPAGYSSHEYSLFKVDQALKEFFEKYENKDWFKNTIFVFSSDNGAPLKLLADSKGISEDLYYNRTPFVVYRPKFKSQKIINKISSQVDITPTIFHLMGVNNSTNHFVGNSIFSKDSSIALQYKHYNNFFTIPDIGAENVDKLRKIYMSFVFENKISPKIEEDKEK